MFHYTKLRYKPTTYTLWRLLERILWWTMYQNHITILCVTQQVCTDCENNEDVTIFCETCGIPQRILDKDPVNELIDLYVRPKTKFSRITLIAHNSSGFDAQFILRALIERFDKDVPSVILDGSKIAKIDMGRSMFIDSLNYFHSKLSVLPKAFGLNETLKKIQS